MEIRFFYNKSDSRVINKNLVSNAQGGDLYQGQLRDEISVISPIVLIDTGEIDSSDTFHFNYNYAYIPAFNRYYYINNVNALRAHLWELYLSVDVLMSFRNDILGLNVVVDKQSMLVNSDEYIDDGSLVAENVMFQTVYNFENGFNSTSEFILTTAG